MTIQEQKRLAVLIDADNSQPSILEGLLEEVANYGIASVKRIYGDWGSDHMRRWRELLLAHALQPVQQNAYTKGKNATDMAMIIDAMDILYTGRMDGFCLVSSDSDFAPLAQRIRQEGLTVYGFGEQKTPHGFVAACDRFIYTEVLRKQEDKSGQSGARRQPLSGKTLKGDTRLVNLVRNAVEDSADEAGWASLGVVGQNISNRAADFDPRNYGYKKLGELVKAINLFDVDERPMENSPALDIYIRDPRRKG